MRPAAARPPRRGGIGIAMIVALVVIELIIVGAVLTTARNQDTAALRIDGMRAFYATEAGANMALRELMIGTDADGDGGIGSISNDGNPGNNPLFVSGSCFAVAAAASGNTEITVSGAAGLCRSSVTVTFVPGGGAGPARRCVYSDWPSSSPQTRTWNGSAWSSPSATASATGGQYWALARRCPTRNEVAAVYICQSNRLDAAVLTDSTWGASQTLCNDVGSHSTRPVSLAYEQNSGRALLVYRKGDTPTVFYRTWNGLAWSTEQSVASPLVGNPVFLKLVPKPASNEIMLLVLATQRDLCAMVWNGSAFGNTVTLDINAASAARECMDGAYATGSSNCLVVWGKMGVGQPQCRVWDGSTWSALSTAPDVGATPHWVRLAADPGSGKILLGTLDSAADINVNAWSGGAWGTNLEVESAAAAAATRTFDLAYTTGGGTAVLLWGGSSATPRFRVYDGASWGAQQNAPALSATVQFVQLTPQVSGGQLLALCSLDAGQNSLESLVFAGGSFSGHQQLESNLTGSSSTEAFMAVDQPPGTPAADALRGWTQAAPQ